MRHNDIVSSILCQYRTRDITLSDVVARNTYNFRITAYNQLGRSSQYKTVTLNKISEGRIPFNLGGL